ncbi:MAG: sulfurtransferase TusA family protein [Promethearchaeati archaeon SRVP18_Atabeyarchaeia-1]
MASKTSQSSAKADLVINALGQKCPMPILTLKDNLESIRVGQTAELIGDDIGSKTDVPAFCKRTGQELLKTWEDNGTLHFLIKKLK